VTPDTVHSTGLAEMVALARTPAVAQAAGVDASLWGSVASPRVLSGDRRGLIGTLHRGRLPAMELWDGGEITENTNPDESWITVTWGIRARVGGVSKDLAENLARAMLAAVFSVIRGNLRQRWGGESCNAIKSDTLSHYVEGSFTVINRIARGTFGLQPGRLLLENGGCLLLENGGHILLESINPVSVEVLPVLRVTRRGYTRVTQDGAARQVQYP
jgi:hypothetical protein